MSAESGKVVDRYEVSSWGSYPMRKDPNGEYVEYEDYAKIEQQRAALEDRVTALVEALTIARDYITSELARERDTFKGHENCSDIPAIERDLAQTDAALRAAGVVL